MKISLAIHFPLCTLGSKNMLKMSQNSLHVEKYVENILTNTWESELPS